MYNKKVLNRATANLDKAKAPAKKKDIIVDPEGQWKYPGQNTRIPGGNITMQGVSYPVLAQPNVGQPQMMYPGMDYEFPGADYVDEFPQGTNQDYIEADLTDEEIEEYRKGGYIVEDISIPSVGNYKKGGSLLTKKVTCKKCGWNWDAADGGDDITTCHKCGGSGLVHAQLGKTVGRYFVNPYEYNYDTRALRTKEDLDPAFGVGVTRENLFSGPRVKENEVSTTGTISSRIPYNNFKPSVRGQLDISYEPKPKGALIPSTNTMMGVGYDPTVGFNSDLTVNQRFGFANVDASRFKKDDWKKGSATWGIGPAIETSFQTKAPDTLHGQEVDPNFTATSTKGAQFAGGLYADAAFQPFKYPMHIGANAKLMADPFSAKSADSAAGRADENLNWTINPGLKVYASFPIRTNKLRPTQPEITKNLPIKSKYTPKYLQEGGTADNYFTVPGSDGVYRKVNGKWQVDWNRSGKFQPLSKGDVAKRTAVLDKQAKPLYDRDYNSLVESRSYEAAPKKTTAQPQTATQKKAQQNFNQNFKVSAKDNYTKVKDRIDSDKEKLLQWSAENNVPIDQKQLDDYETWGWNVYGKVGAQHKPDEIHTFNPEAPQGFLDKTADVLSNPMTSLGYFMRGQDIPDYMQRDMDRGTFGYYANGDLHTERNPFDYVADFTPLGLVNDTRNVINGISEGDLGKTGLGLLSAVPGFSELRSASKAAKVLDNANEVKKNVYKLNPLAPKLGEYNRVVGQDAIDDIAESGLVRINENAGVAQNLGPFGIQTRTTPYPSFGKAKPQQTYIDQVVQQGKTPYIISTDRPMRASTFGRHGKGTTQFPVDDTGNYITGFPASEAQVFEGTPHWLKGYKKVPIVSKETNIKLLPDDVRSAELDMETFGIYKGDQRVGEVSGNRLSNGDFETMDIGVDPKFQKQGIGTETYRQLNESLPEGNKVRSWGAFVEENGVAPGRNTWQSLERQGLAKKNEKGIYEMTPNTFSNSNEAVKAGFDGNFITRPLTPFGKNELTPGNQWYRKIGNEAGLRDLIKKQGAQAPAPMRMKSGLTLDAPFFGRGSAPNESYKGLYTVELKPEAASKYNWKSRVAGVDNYGSVPFNNEGVMQNMPLEDLNVYKKKWFSNNYKKLDPNNLDNTLMNDNLQRGLENIYKWGVRGYLGKSAYDYVNQPEEKNNDLYNIYQKGGKLGPIHLNEGRKTLRDWVYGADIGMMQEQDGGYTDAELTDEEIQAYRDAGYYIEELD